MTAVRQTLRMAFLGALLLLAACAGQTAFKSTVAVCSAAGGVLSTLAFMERTGELPEEQAARIDRADAAMRPICTAPTPPTGLETLLLIETQLFALEGIILEIE